MTSFDDLLAKTENNSYGGIKVGGHACEFEFPQKFDKSLVYAMLLYFSERFEDLILIFSRCGFFHCSLYLNSTVL